MGVGAIPAGDHGGTDLRDAGTVSSELRDARPGAAIGLSRSRTFMPELESLRGIAVLLVFAFHVHGFVLFPFGAATDRASLPMAFVRGGHSGVDLFFLLSAFLLSRPVPRRRPGRKARPAARLLHSASIADPAALLDGRAGGEWTVAIGNGRFASGNQWWHGAEGVGWAVVLLLLLVAPLRLAPLLSNRLLSLLGVLSYSIYLLHAPFMMILIQAFVGPRAWTPWAWTLVSVLSLALLGACTLTYRFIERPFLVRKARFDT